MERTFRVKYNMMELNKDSILTESEAKKYFSVDLALKNEIIEEITIVDGESKMVHILRFSDKIIENDFFVYSVPRMLFPGDLIFFVDTGEILKAGSFELTEDFFKEEVNNNLKLFYSEEERDLFLNKEFKSRFLVARNGIPEEEKQATINSVMNDKLFSLNDIKKLFNEASTGCSECNEAFANQVIYNALVELI